jgi:hypothetical protein
MLTARFRRFPACRCTGLLIRGFLNDQRISQCLKRFGTADEVICFEKGRFEKVTLGGVTTGRAVYEPPWKWSTQVGSKTDPTLCQVEQSASKYLRNCYNVRGEGSVNENSVNIFR